MSRLANPRWISASIKHGDDSYYFAIYTVVDREGESTGQNAVITGYLFVNATIRRQSFDVSDYLFSEIASQAYSLTLIEPKSLRNVDFCIAGDLDFQ